MPDTHHGTCCVVGTRGLLIRGKTGSGKTALADHLVETARLRGNFAAFVADDRVGLEAVAGRLLARAPEPIAGLLEVRGLGIVETGYLDRAQIHLIVDLVPEETLDRMPEPVPEPARLEGLDMPRVACPQREPMLAARMIRWTLRGLFPEGPDYI